MASFTPHLHKRVSKWNKFKGMYGNDGDEFDIKPGEHYFVDFDDEVKEQAKKEKGIAEYEHFDKEHHEHAIVAVGTTGTGKSSIVQLFCGDDVLVGHNTNSSTKRAELYLEIGDDAMSNRKWMDTQGTDDTDMDDTDEKILKKIFKKLWLKKIHFITVLWLISGDFDRQKGEYLRQAEFINSLQSPESPSNVWKSVLMIQKMGTLQPKMKKVRGIIDAAKKNGANLVYMDEDSVRDHLVGFKCIELIELKGDDPMYEALMDAETSTEKMIELGYVSKDQMKSIITERLQKLPCFMLSYQDMICEKCSLRGDPRYLYYKCHQNPKPHHPKPLEPYHPEPLEQFHPLDTHITHVGKVQHNHPGVLRNFHPMEIVQKEVDDTDHPIYDHEGDYITIISGNMCCTKESQKWNCCHMTQQFARGCRTTYPRKEVLIYPCCGVQKDKDVDDQERGCDDDFHGGCQKQWSCCLNPEDAEPCEHKFDCCGKGPNSEGCEVVWKCCEELEAAIGCKERYQCCHMPEDARGCEDRWGCCFQAPEERGCIVICDRCSVRWGHKPGCTWPQIDDDENDDFKKYHDESDENRTDDYDETSNPVVQQEAVRDKQMERQSLLLKDASPAPIMGSVPEHVPTGHSEQAVQMMEDSDTPQTGGYGVPEEDVPVGSKPTEALL